MDKHSIDHERYELERDLNICLGVYSEVFKMPKLNQ